MNKDFGTLADCERAHVNAIMAGLAARFNSETRRYRTAYPEIEISPNGEQYFLRSWPASTEEVARFVCDAHGLKHGDGSHTCARDGGKFDRAQAFNSQGFEEIRKFNPATGEIEIVVIKCRTCGKKVASEEEAYDDFFVSALDRLGCLECAIGVPDLHSATRQARYMRLGR